MTRLLRLLAPALLLISLAPAARATCGAEGCPFVRDAFGTAVGRFAFDLRYQDVKQDKLWDGSHSISTADAIGIADAAEHGEVELFTRTRSWVGEARAQVTPDLRFTATLPYIDREHRHYLKHFNSTTVDPRFLNRWKYTGLGDATVLGFYRALHLQGLPSVSLEGGVKLPTGRRHLPDETLPNGPVESTLEPSARPGTGSTDWLTGALVSQALPWKGVLPVIASVLLKFNGKGTDGFRAGNEVQVGLSGGYSPISKLTLLAQLNFSGHGADESEEATEVAHNGMRSMFVTPGITYRVTEAVTVYGLYQARVSGHSDEATVVATNHFMLGTTYSIGH